MLWPHCMAAVGLHATLCWPTLGDRLKRSGGCGQLRMNLDKCATAFLCLVGPHSDGTGAAW
jgi:hypothetical protein